jgi:adenylate cyclase
MTDSDSNGKQEQRDYNLTEKNRGNSLARANVGPQSTNGAATGRKRPRRDLVIAIGVSVAVLILFFLRIGFLENIEAKLFDAHFHLRGPRPTNDAITIVAIDEKSLAAVGRWPWSRSVQAQLLEAVGKAGAKAVGFDIILSEAEKDLPARLTDRLLARYEQLGLSQAGPKSSEFYEELRRLRGSDGEADARLGEALQRVPGNVIAAFFLMNPEEGAMARIQPPLKSRIIAFRGPKDAGIVHPVSGLGMMPPIPSLVRATQGLGHVNVIPDSDGVVRWDPLVIEYQGAYYPSLPLEVVRQSLGLAATDLQIDFDGGIRLGNMEIPTDHQLRLLLNYAGPAKSFRHVSAVDVMSGNIPEGSLKDHLVFVGATSSGIYDVRVTPVDPVFPGVEIHATVADNLLGGHFLRRPVWEIFVTIAGIILLSLVVVVVTRQFRPLGGTVATLLLAGGVFGVAHVLFRSPGYWLPILYPMSSLALTYTGCTLHRVLTEQRERAWLKRAFQQYVPHDVVQQIADDPKALVFGGERRHLTVLFTDLRDFTTYSEEHEPEEVVEVLREYLTAMVDIIFKHGGTVDKFIGDSILGIFGAPLYYTDHAARACRAAFEMAEQLKILQARWQAEQKTPLRMGIGVSTGEVVVGNLGSEQRFDYTVIGDAVNLGARLESANKDFPTQHNIIISESTYQEAKDTLEANPLGEVVVKGKREAVSIYELVNIRYASSGQAPAVEVHA